MNVGLCCMNVGLCCMNVGLCCMNVGLLCEHTGLFGEAAGLCCMNVGLCCMNVGLFGEDIDAGPYVVKKSPVPFLTFLHRGQRSLLHRGPQSHNLFPSTH